MIFSLFPVKYIDERMYYKEIDKYSSIVGTLLLRDMYTISI